MSISSTAELNGISCDLRAYVGSGLRDDPHEIDVLDMRVEDWLELGAWLADEANGDETCIDALLAGLGVGS